MDLIIILISILSLYFTTFTLIDRKFNRKELVDAIIFTIIFPYTLLLFFYYTIKGET